MAGYGGNATSVRTVMANGSNDIAARDCLNVGAVGPDSLGITFAISDDRLGFNATSTHGRCCHTRHEWRVFRVM